MIPNIKNCCIILSIIFCCSLIVSCDNNDYHLIPYRNYRISNDRMFPNYPAKSIIWILRTPFISRASIERGDIVIFNENEDGAITPYIGRVIGLPGDTIVSQNGNIKINDKELNHVLTDKNETQNIIRESNHSVSYLVAYYKNAERGKRIDFKVKVSNDEFFLMNDNRDSVYDSLIPGSVKTNKVIGKKISFFD